MDKQHNQHLIHQVQRDNNHLDMIKIH